MSTLLTDPHLKRRQIFLSPIKKRVKPGTGRSLTFLNKRTWTLPATDLRQLIKDVPFAVVGGVATRLYMPERMTLDLAIIIAADKAQLAYQNLRDAGATKVSDLTIPGSQWNLPNGTSLDVLEINEPWLETALESPNYAPDGLPIIDLPYLILMKLNASRSQDLADISRMVGCATDSQLEKVRIMVAKYLPTATATEDLESLIMLGKLEQRTD
ncbi:hypothetical protein IQ225_09360 [Synechocystis salina LEGE 06155]|nr:hypothetical protein [Synechocystis salina LEGE 06155]